MRISIASFSFHHHIQDGQMSIFGYLETCKYRYGLDAADIWNGLMGSDPDSYLQPEFVKKVRAALDERELTCVNYHADGCHPWEDDPAWREKAHDLTLRHIQAAAALGAKTFRVDTGGRNPEWSDQEFDHIANRYREYAQICGDLGMKVGPENHWGSDASASNVLRLAKAVDNPAFGVLMHVGRYSDVEPLVGDRMLAPLAMHTHLEPRVINERIDEVLDILDAAGYTGYFDVENGAGGNEYEQVGTMIAQVKEALARRRGMKAAGGPNELIPEGIQEG